MYRAFYLEEFCIAVCFSKQEYEHRMNKSAVNEKFLLKSLNIH